MNKVLVFTVIYPQAEKYKFDFIECLSNQTFKDFDLLIVNDGCNKEILSRDFSNFQVSIIDTNLTPVKNREIGIKYSYDKKYEKLIFCDIDDWHMPTRFETSLRYLEYSDIVVNNLNIVGENRELLCGQYFSYSVKEGTKINRNFLMHKNLLGLSNTALKIQEKCLVEFPKDLSIGDWYYFSICAERGLHIIYCDEALTDYRQHNNNLIGIDDFSVPLFRKLSKLKLEHYKYLSALYPSYIKLFKEYQGLDNITDDEIDSIIQINKINNPHPLWWENIKR